MPTEEWLGQLAESEGVSREDILQQLVSSYWTLKEMHGLMEQTEEGREVESEEWPLDIESLYSNAFADEVDEITARLERLEDREAGTDLTALRAEVEMLADRVDAIESSLGGRQDAIEDRVDEEFGNLERILDYLIETADSLEEDLESVTDEQEAGRRWRTQQERLTELKHLASRLGVRKASCEYCDASVDIALLPTPECPQCDRQFTDIDPARRWFGLGSSTLKVTGEPYIDDGSERGHGRTDGGGDVDEPATDGSFVWGEELD